MLKLVVGKFLTKDHAKPVESWDQIEAAANELQSFLKVSNGHFVGQHASCYALHHVQVKEVVGADEVYQPYDFFVASENMVGTDPIQFKYPVMVNPEVLEKPEKIKRTMPVKKEVKEGDSISIKFESEEKDIKNLLIVPEACMSFPFRAQKNYPRYYEIKVRYQVPMKGIIGGMKLKTIEETLTGLKAHIFQHECDHSKAKNIFH